MPVVFTKAKRSQVMSRIRGRGSELFEIEVVATDAEVFDDVGDDAAGNVARMPREGDDPVRAKGIGVVAVTAGVAQMFATDFAEAALQLAAVPRGVFARESGGENELVTKGGRNGAAGVEQGLEMRFGRQLEAEDGLAAILSVRVAARQQRGPGNPHAVFVAAHLNFGNGNNHDAATIARRASGVKRAFDA